MKIEIENLKAQMTGKELNIYQKADALIEFNKLLDYVNELEQLTIPVVVKSFYCHSEEACGLRCGKQCLGCNGMEINKPTTP
jgi:hypothetical protein